MKRIISNKIAYFSAIVALLTISIAVYAQHKHGENDKAEMSCPMMEKMADKNKSHEDCPMLKKDKSQTSEKKTDDMSNHADHYKTVQKNGEREMGFSQTATTHHFLIMSGGGAIQVETNNSQDAANRDKIRGHLMEIAKMFQSGDFKTPFAVHGQIPPGVPEMENFKNKIRYAYEETENGARVRISTDDQKALAAIHKFLEFQIKDHQTGDPINAGN